jgi:hypothetical protein
VTEQGYPPRRPDHPGRTGRPRTPPESRNSGWQMLDAFDGPTDPDADVPPWAIPGGIEPIRPVRRAARSAQPAHAAASDLADPDLADPDLADPDLADDTGRADDAGRANAGQAGSGPGPDSPARSVRRPGRSRAAATRRRRSRRRLVTWGSVAIVVVIVAGVVYFVSRPKAAPHLYVTALQKGEYRNVPNACQVISAAALGQYLGGSPSKGVQSSSGGGNSECTYQFDAKPTFRVLDVTLAAYAPSLIAPGNGSATSYATYTFAQTRLVLARPPKHATEPPATITPVALGEQALSAVQIYHVGPVQDRATVLVRWHNVLITVSLWATASGGFGPVSIPGLGADVLSAARAALAVVKAQPTVGS